MTLYSLTVTSVIKYKLACFKFCIASSFIILVAGGSVTSIWSKSAMIWWKSALILIFGIIN